MDASDPRRYTVGWICAIDTEAIAAYLFLDEVYEEASCPVSDGDTNSYTYGRMGEHNVVIACQPRMGIADAAAVAVHMLHSFTNVRVGLMVGIGGGAPRINESDGTIRAGYDIRLGDIVVATQVIQYDSGKARQGHDFEVRGTLNLPPTILQNAVNSLKTRYSVHGNSLKAQVEARLAGKKRSLVEIFRCPPKETDLLFASSHVHPDNAPTEGCLGICDHVSSNSKKRKHRDEDRSDDTRPSRRARTVVEVDGAKSRDIASMIIDRPTREDDDETVVHYGKIGSGNQVVKDARLRDVLATRHDVLCYEMEAAGLMNNFPCLVIRGICDYADSHKNDVWQGYAAMVAAAYARDLLNRIARTNVEKSNRLAEGIELLKHELATMEKTTREARDDAQMSRVKAWLNAPDPATNKHKAQGKCHKGTGEWFLESSEFNGWKSGSRRHLWLQAQAGSGKTVLASTILGHLDASPDHDDTIYFFFDFSDSNKQKRTDLFKSLLLQLHARQHRKQGQASTALEAMMRKSIGRGENSAEQLEACLYDMLTSSGDTTIRVVIDALDECTERKELVQFLLRSFQHPALQHVHLIATSRVNEEHLTDLRELFAEEDCVKLEQALVDADIAMYCQDWLTRSKWDNNPEVRRQIARKIGPKAKGSFRWAACVLQSLEECLDREAVESELDKLPEDLTGFYHRALSKIPSQRQEKAYRLLSLLIIARRPLRIETVRTLLAVRFGLDQPFDKSYMPPRCRDVLAYCPSFVQVVIDKDREKYPTFQLAHFSVKEFLINDAGLGLDLENAGGRIALTCLHLVRGTTTDEDFRYYAGSHWLYGPQSMWDDSFEYADQVPEVVDEMSSLLVEHIPSSRLQASFLADAEFLHGLVHFREGGRRKRTSDWDVPVSISAFHDMPRLLGKLLLRRSCKLTLRGQDIPQSPVDPLTVDVAARRTDLSCLQILLDNGNRPHDPVSVLVQAATTDRHDALQLLWDHGVTATASTIAYILHQATASGFPETVQMILQRFYRPGASSADADLTQILRAAVHPVSNGDRMQGTVGLLLDSYGRNIPDHSLCDVFSEALQNGVGADRLQPLVEAAWARGFDIQEYLKLVSQPGVSVRLTEFPSKEPSRHTLRRT